jgi:hypothetical protein
MDIKIAEIAETQKQFAECRKILEKCREHLRESHNRKDSKDEERETVMSAKKLLEKEGFLVKRMREETDFEDEDDEYDEYCS